MGVRTPALILASDVPPSAPFRETGKMYQADALARVRSRLSAVLGRASWHGEVIYFHLMRPVRVARRRARWTFARRSLATCDLCGATAVWDYAPVGPKHCHCDGCVPRGCSCNIIGPSSREPPNGSEPDQHRDLCGRLLPCCEVDFRRWGFPNRE